MKKIFIISPQRSGTTTAGTFLERLGFSQASWSASKSNSWSEKWYHGRWDEIFESNDFQANSVMQDFPWFAPKFYRFLAVKFPDSQFVFLHRNVDAWVNSLSRFNKGRIVNPPYIHGAIYRREHELLALDARFQLSVFLHEKHYSDWYKSYLEDVLKFFECQSMRKRLFVGALEENSTFADLAEFVGVGGTDVKAIHANRGDVSLDVGRELF